jgi:hypothetical protein
MIIKPNMSLQVPEVGDADYPNSVSASFDNIDAHDHTAGAGVQIPSGGIIDLAITTGKIANDAVTTAKILDLNVTTGKLADNAVTKPKLAALGQQSANQTGLGFATQSGLYVNVPGLSVTITTTGRPVMLVLDSASFQGASISFTNYSGNQSFGYGAFRRGVVEVGVFPINCTITSAASSSSSSTTTPVSPPAPAYTTTTTTSTTVSNTVYTLIPANFVGIDIQAAGTYTYTFSLLCQQPLSGPLSTISLAYARLTAFEL